MGWSLLWPPTTATVAAASFFAPEQAPKTLDTVPRAIPVQLNDLTRDSSKFEHIATPDVCGPVAAPMLLEHASSHETRRWYVLFHDVPDKWSGDPQNPST
ncbi:hypothetical protein BJ166DRAFT_511207 [Pestalotiopsis sp. NC0098]|nr:hypothetical protein BJ166DRAFT_511207 [Pestalotiopsis sp. NC0098]